MKSIKPAIGIITYLPDEKEFRRVRLERCLKLIDQLDRLMKLPIIIVAQNWTMSELQMLTVFKNEPITIKACRKLGITKARWTLRKEFLATDYTTLAHFDDDYEFNEEDTKAINVYKMAILTRPECCLEIRNFLFNGLVIPRSVYEKEDFDLAVDPENGNGYEDWVFVMNLKNKYRERYLRLDLDLCITDRHTMTLDKYSTWRDSETSDQTDISRKHILKNALKVAAERKILDEKG